MVAGVEDVDRPPFEDGFGEEEVGHIGPAPGTVHGEEAQARAWQTVEMGIAVGHHLVGLLRRAVERDRVIGRVVDRVGHPGVQAVDRAAGREDQVLDLPMAAAFEDVEKSGQVGAEIGLRVGERVADTGLRGEVDDAIEPHLTKERGHGLAIGDIRPDEAEARLPLQARQPRLFQPHVIVVVEIIDAGNLVPPRQQPPRQVEPDEAGRAGYQYSCHGLASQSG